jgi:hypothetical protein
MSEMIFDWKEHDDAGTGWLARGYPNFGPTDWNQFGHDCMEHFPRGRTHGQIADELLALGARLYIRVAGGWWFTQRGFPTPAESWAGELEGLLRDMEDDSRLHLPDFTQRPAPPAPEYRDVDMEKIIQAALVQAVARANEYLFNGDPDNDDEPFTLESQLIVRMGDWLRRGVHACIKRYKGRDADDIMWLQIQLDEEVRDFQKPGSEEHRLVVRIHEKDMEYTVERYRPPYDE